MPVEVLREARRRNAAGWAGPSFRLPACARASSFHGVGALCFFRGFVFQRP